MGGYIKGNELAIMIAISNVVVIQIRLTVPDVLLKRSVQLILYLGTRDEEAFLDNLKPDITRLLIPVVFDHNAKRSADRTTWPR
jgi:hypothetical protein